MRIHNHLSTLLFLAATKNLRALAQEQTWTISNVNMAPDGVERSIVAVNKQFPGPTLRFKKGENPKINVVNQLADKEMLTTTSIHWHGIFQAKAAFDDGPAFVTQCPIVSGHNYVYQLQTGEQYGTYWYHSHHGAQYLDGLRGPLIIDDPNDAHRSLYDEDEHIVFLADWYHDKGQNLIKTYNTTTGEVPIDSGTINGKGQTLTSPDNHEVFNVKNGTKYRFRIINASGAAVFNFQIQNHTFTVIELDGVNHNATEASVLKIWPGQRYSIVVNANQGASNYWVRAQMLDYQGSEVISDKVNGILRYEGAPSQKPEGDPPAITGTFDDRSFIPWLNPTPWPAESEIKTINLAISQNGQQWTVNQRVYHPPDVPTLLQILSHNKTLFTEDDSVNHVEKGQVVDIVIDGAYGHPIHMHGHNFWVIQGGDDAEPKPSGSMVPLRDVVVGGFPTRIRFIADNPGPWIIHCHVDLHFDLGFAWVVAESVDAQQTDLHPDPAWSELCELYKDSDEAKQASR